LCTPHMLRPVNHAASKAGCIRDNASVMRPAGTEPYEHSRQLCAWYYHYTSMYCHCTATLPRNALCGDDYPKILLKCTINVLQPYCHCTSAVRPQSTYSRTYSMSYWSSHLQVASFMSVLLSLESVLQVACLLHRVLILLSFSY
jgi:hypothetical protein